MNRISIALLFLLVSYGSWSQNKKLDSLYSVLQNHPQEDTLRAWLLVSICYYEYTSDNEKNKILAEQAQTISRKINYKKGIGMALKSDDPPQATSCLCINKVTQQKYLSLQHMCGAKNSNSGSFVSLRSNT